MSVVLRQGRVSPHCRSWAGTGWIIFAANKETHDLDKIGAGVAIGTAVGAGIGAAMGNVSAGIAIGIAIGAAIGYSRQKGDG